MKKITMYQADAFADKLFGGNPAAVCSLDEWPEDNILQNIAAENNLAETAFYLPKGDGYELRWFTPTHEVDLCGHATLASAFCLYELQGFKGELLKFYTRKSGVLTVRKDSDWFILDFPVDSYRQVEFTGELEACFKQKPMEVYKGKSDYMLVFEKESDISSIEPHFDNITKLNARGVIVTAEGNNCDFVSRFFAPQIGVKEDYVTGSAHTTLIPYWSKRLNKTELSAIQLSSRKGLLRCKLNGDRVDIGGQVQLYMKGEIYIG